MVYIGVDLGGTGIKAGVVDEQGNILAKDSCPTGVERGYAAVIQDIASLCTRVASRAVHDMSEIKAIGIGLPGIYVPSTGRVPFCTNLGWHDVPLLAEMRKYTDLPVFADNDANVAGLAEAVAGVSKGCNVSIFVTLGTGVGGGIIIDGKAYSGPHGIASEIGHMITVAGGEECTCGNKGCWERYASATAIIREARKYAQFHPDCAILKSVDGDMAKIEARTVIDLAKEGEPVSMQLFDDYVHHLCVGLVNLINLYDPEMLVLGGGVSHAGQFLLDRVNAILPGLIFYKTMPYATVRLATLGNDAGIIGAAMLGR